MLNLDGPLWRFSVSFYRRPGVAEALLELQDDGELDTLIVLVLVYAHAILKRPLSVEDLQAAENLVADWRAATVAPIRHIRRALKRPAGGFPQPESEHLRTEIKRVELLSEQVQLAMLEDWLDRSPASAGMPIEAALRWLLARKGDDGPHADEAMAAVIAAAEQPNAPDPARGRAVR